MVTAEDEGRRPKKNALLLLGLMFVAAYYSVSYNLGLATSTIDSQKVYGNEVCDQSTTNVQNKLKEFLDLRGARYQVLCSAKVKHILGKRKESVRWLA